MYFERKDEKEDTKKDEWMGIWRVPGWVSMRRGTEKGEEMEGGHAHSISPTSSEGEMGVRETVI